MSGFDCGDLAIALPRLRAQENGKRVASTEGG